MKIIKALKKIKCKGNSERKIKATIAIFENIDKCPPSVKINKINEAMDILAEVPVVPLEIFVWMDDLLSEYQKEDDHQLSA